MPLEVPEAGIMQPMLESMQSQLKVAQRLSTLLLAQSDDTVGSTVAQHLAHMEDHVKEALRCLNTPHIRTIQEVSPTIPWVAASPSETGQQEGGYITCVREAKS